MRTKTSFLTLAFALVTLGSATSLARAPLDEMRGVWLIEPEYFDPWVEVGAVAARYPALIVRPDRTFDLVSVGGPCELVEATGRSIEPRSDPLRHATHCWRLLTKAKQDGIAAFLDPRASGRIDFIGQNTVRFMIESTAPVTWSDRSALASWVERPQETLARTLNGLPQQQRDRFQSLFQTQRARLRTFFTSFFLFDGKAVEVAIENELLVLKHAQEKLAFRKIRPAVLGAAMALLDGASYAKYFRCAVQRVRKSWPTLRQQGDKLFAYVQLSLELEDIRERVKFARLLEAAGKSGEASSILPSAGMAYARLADLNERHARAPATLAKQQFKFGAYLGCPEMDEN